MFSITECVGFIGNTIEDFIFKCDNRAKSGFFARSGGKLSFQKLVTFVLSLPKASLQIEVNRFLKNYLPDVETLSGVAINKARLKLLPKAFVTLNDGIVQRYYADEHETFEGYRVIAVDGTLLQLPDEAGKYFGVQKTPGFPTAMAQACSLYDVINNMNLAAVIEPLRANERQQAASLIDKLAEIDRQFGVSCKNLFLLDRGFPSREMLQTLNKQSYLARVSSAFLKEINESNLPDQSIVVTLEDGSNINVRVVNIVLQSGECEKLITNLFDMPIDILSKLYAKRWGIEVNYRTLKSRLQLENFSGSLRVIIEQDFYASVLISNIVSIAQRDANVKIAAMNAKKNLKHEYVVNTNIAISEIIPGLICVLLEDDPVLARSMLNGIMNRITKFTKPIRKDRTFPRQTKHPFQRFPLNSKSNR